MTDVIGEHTIKANIIGGGTPISANVIKNKQKIVSQVQTYQQATTTTKGILRLATVEEALEGVDNATAITPLTLNEKFMDVSYYAGDGIRIRNRVISVNDDVIASKEFVNDTLSNQITILDDKIDSLTGALSDSIEGIDSIIGGYGDIVTYNASDFATSIQGGLADTALQPNDNISELTNDVGYITSASIPIVNDGKLALQVNSVDVGEFTANQSSTTTVNISVPTQASDINAVPTSRTVNNKALSSNITLSASDVGALADSTTINDLTTTAQLNALNSGATSTNIGQITTNTNDISTINGKIPLAASTSNQLADKSYVDTVDSGLQSQINDLKARGRFLALWNCATGLAETNPPQSPYTYQAGDYFIVGTVSTATPTVNYKPNGSSYTTGVASTVVETDVVDIDDVYYYDGTNWKLQVNTQKTVSFVNIAGSPYDNTNLSTALNAKADTSSLATVATSGSYNDLTDKPTIPDAQVQSDWNVTDTTSKAYIKNKPTIPSGVIVDQTYDGTSTNAQSGVAIEGELANYVETSDLATVATSGSYDDLTDKPTIPTNYVTIDTDQDITGRKTFLGEKAIYFKQSATTNKLGFTLYNTSSTEIGAFEYRPNTISTSALLNVNCSYSGSDYVGFRYWGTAVNIIAPKVATAGNYYIPVNITDGTNTVTANNKGVVNISSLLPDLSNYVTSSTLTTTLADYVLSSSLATVATSGSYNDLSNKPTIPTVNDGTITINQGGTQKGTFTLNQSGNTTIDLDAGGGGSVDIPNNVLAFDNDAEYIAESQLGDTFAITETAGQPYPYANISGSNFSMQGDVSTSLTKNSTTLQLFTFANGKIDVTKHIVMDFHQRPDDTDSYTYGNYTATPTFADTPILGKMVDGVFTPKIYITSDTIYEVSAVDSTSYSSGVTTYTLTTSAIGTITISPSGADLVTVMLKAKNASSPSWRLQVTSNANSSQITYETIWTSSSTSYEDILDYIDTVVFVENTTNIPVRCVGEWEQALYYTPTPLRTVANMSTVDMIGLSTSFLSNYLTAESPLELSNNYSGQIVTSPEIEYDYETGLITTAFTGTYQEGYIRFEVPDNLNINALTNYWRFGTKTQNIFAYLYQIYSNANVIEITDEDGDLVSRVWYGSNAYRRGLSASSANYSINNNEIMHHIANAQGTYQNTNSDNFSQDITIANKKLKYLQIYYVSNGNSNIGIGIFNSGTTNYLNDIRIFTSADDTEGILLQPSSAGLTVKLNYGSGLEVVGNKLVCSAIDYINGGNA